MAAENDFLAAVGAYLQAALQAAGLTPAPKAVGIAEPGDSTELPAVVLSLESNTRPANGLGGARALIAGTLRLDVCALLGADVAALSAAAIEALLAPAARDAVHRLLAIHATELGSIGAPEERLALRRRTARFDFVFESTNVPAEPPGDVIRTITIETGLTVATVDPASGAITTVEASLPDEELGA